MARISQITFLVVGIVLLVLGAVYSGASGLMPYHQEAISTDWGELNPSYQGLFIGFLRGMGGGALTCGAAITFMSVKMLRGTVRPYLVLLPGVSIVYVAFLSFATYTVYTNTPASPPLGPVLLLLLMSLAATVLLWLGHRSGEDLNRE